VFRWGFVEVESKTTWPDEMQAFAAGMAEGYLTKDLIYYFWQNMIEVIQNTTSVEESYVLTYFICFRKSARISPKFVST
jgi:hypothetical protein